MSNLRERVQAEIEHLRQAARARFLEPLSKSAFESCAEALAAILAETADDGSGSHVAALDGKFRKRPVVIEAIQWDGDNIGAVRNFMHPVEPIYMAEFSNRDEIIGIDTLEGRMVAKIGDWIIRGIAGELYPCKPDIFSASYEPAALAADEQESAQLRADAESWRQVREIANIMPGGSVSIELITAANCFALADIDFQRNGEVEIERNEDSGPHKTLTEAVAALHAAMMKK